VFARVTMFEGSPEQIAEGVRVWREDVMPWLRDATGFRGWVALVDPENQKGLGISFWETEEAMADSAASGAALRDEVASAVGTPMTGTEFYEVVVVDTLALDETP
jgi:heme-degrading monooxygenase HmoA